MNLLRRGLQLGHAVKGAKRLQQIVSVFARHGFEDVLIRMNLRRFVPSLLLKRARSETLKKSTAHRLRESFEELGPTFVKLGQLLSTRSDLFPEEVIQEFTRLQDNVQPVPFEAISERIEEELGKSVYELFLTLDQKPLASASIAQVHRATLLNGETVVVKVQRPHIEEIIKTDVQLIAFLAKLIERTIPELRIIQPTVIVEEFFSALKLELDFRIEANNTEKMRSIFLDTPEIVIPKVFSEVSSERVLTLELLTGIQLNQVAKLDSAGIDRKALVRTSARAFFRSILIEGFFHGDLHGGNLFALSNNRLGIIDFGIVGRLSAIGRRRLAQMVVALIEEDYERLCEIYAELGQASASIDFEGFQREVRNTLSPYMGLSLKEMNVGKILSESTRIATRYSVRVPGEWMLVFKAIITTEGMGRSLDPDFDLLEMSDDLLNDLVRSQYSPQELWRELSWFSRDTIALIQQLPKQLRWMLRRLTANDFAIEIRIPEIAALHESWEEVERKKNATYFIGFLLITGALSLSYQDYLIFGFPAISFVAFALAFLGIFRNLLR